MATPSRDELIALAKQIATAHELPPELVCAVCEQESSWNVYAIRFEPEFFKTYVAGLYTNNKIDVTEAYGRAFSWGLMQTMGQVAREFGYEGPLPQLCEPETGIEIGCRVLAHKIKVNEGNLKHALLAWNGGGSKDYPAEVLARADKYRSA